MKNDEQQGLKEIFPSRGRRADLFALTARGRAALQAAASRVELPTAGSCTGEDKEPTDVEKDFAANPRLDEVFEWFI